MKKEFRPIAMKCNQEQFESVRSKLSRCNINSVGNFEKYPFLSNSNGEKISINSINKYGFNRIWDELDDVYETWNEKIFLEACGIETIPTLEEVKEYFKDAEKVQCISYKGLISEIDVNKIKFKYGEYWCEIIDSEINLWDTTKGYAKILTYKEPKEETFVISREQIHRLYDMADIQKMTLFKDEIKLLFPSAFIEDKKELVLEVGNWYKAQSSLFCYQENDNSYGFTDSVWSYCKWVVDVDRVKDNKWNPIKATQEEVEEALTKEAVRRYKVGDYVEFGIAKHIRKIKSKNYIYDKEMNVLLNETDGVFVDGKWAEIIPTITKSEAEQKLNCKII